jgi:putative tryptophan/tyrosine transport system substrate-binding protein
VIFFSRPDVLFGVGEAMRRREFITLLGGAAAAWSLVARAQQQSVKLPTIGFLGSSSAASRGGAVLVAFKRGLADTDFFEGRNVAIEYCWADEHYERLPALAIELVRQQVAVIVAPGSVVAAASAKSATGTIPIVFMIGSDPVEHGFVASLSHPGGNMTGMAYLNIEVAPKRLELLRELLPGAKLIAVLLNPADAINTADQTKELRAAAEKIDSRLLFLNASNATEIEAAFATLAREHADGLLIGVDPLFGSHSDQIIALSARHGVPTIYPWPEFTANGGLMNYGTSILNEFRQVGNYTGQILKGAKPADLPVQRPTKLVFGINQKTAKALGLNIPSTFLARADEVIE